MARFFLSALALSCLFLTGCGLVDSATSTVFQVEAVAVQSSPDANANSATPVDMVFVYQDELIDRLQALNASDWFAQRHQYRRDFPDGIGVKSWEVVPTSYLEAWEVPDNLLENANGKDAVAAFVFADYLTPGAHRARLETQRGLLIDLGRDDFSLKSFNPDQ